MTGRLSGILSHRWRELMMDLPRIWTSIARTLRMKSSSSLEMCQPGLRYGPCPSRREVAESRTWIDRLVLRVQGYVETRQYAEKASSEWLDHMAQRINFLVELTSDQLDAHRVGLVQQMRQGALSDEVLDEALAHAVIAAKTTLLLEPRPNQLIAARVMLRGHFVEMATGEGKTLSIALAAVAGGLSGTPVHVLTANEYLAQRDACSLQAFFECLGLRVASVVSSQDADERRQAYKAHVVYVTAKQVAFDWLNDSIETGPELDAFTAQLSALVQPESERPYRPMLRGLCLAIVDEADSLLIDEARIPLVLASALRSVSEEKAESTVALGLAEQLREGVDYTVLPTTGHVRLTESGSDLLAELSKKIVHIWRSSRFREEKVSQALTALHQFELDRDYIVRDGKLQLVDVHTGRPTPDRRLPHGLHTLLELKEKCSPSPQHETVATVPFQQFFRRYIDLVGISGTLQEVAGEIHHVYNRCVVTVSSHRQSLREDLPPMVLADRSAQLRVMVAEVRQRHELGQPILVCTRSVEQSRGVSALMTVQDIPHQVLNAYQDADEAAIIAGAGEIGSVTVATNMAGRGTDISLGPGVAELGGMHVVSLAFNDAHRLDRQLAGRSARQGDPGSYQQLSSLDDSFLTEGMPSWLKRIAHHCAEKGWKTSASMLIRVAQIRMEWRHKKERMLLYRSRESLEKKLAFGGQPETLA